MGHYRRSDPGGESDRNRRQSCHPAKAQRALEIEAPLGGFSVDKILSSARYRRVSSLRPMT